MGMAGVVNVGAPQVMTVTNAGLVGLNPTLQQQVNQQAQAQAQNLLQQQQQAQHAAQQQVRTPLFFY